MDDPRPRMKNDRVFADGLVIPMFDELNKFLAINGARDLPDGDNLKMLEWGVLEKASDLMYAEDAKNFHCLNKFGDIVRTTAADLIGKGHQGQIQRLFGDPICGDRISKHVGGGDVQLQAKMVAEFRTLVMNTLLQYVKTYRQASTRRILVDPFIDAASVTVKGGEATYTQPLELPSTGGKAAHAHAVMEDFGEHFPELPDFLGLLCAARFAPDRRQAFLWLHCQPGWGKSMFLSAMSQLKLVVEVSGKEAEACFEGKPVGLDPNRLARAWVLAFDEARGVKAETKQLSQSLHLTPKYGQRTEVPVYLKLFISAEGMDSLAGSEGVEGQFADRFSYMTGKGRVEDRPLFKKLGGGAYVRSLAAGISQHVTWYVRQMCDLGRDEAEQEAERQLKELHAKYKITNTHAVLEDTLLEYTEELRQMLRDFATWTVKKGPMIAGPMPRSLAALPQDLRRRLEGGCRIGFMGPRDDRYGVVCLRKPMAFVKAWLNESVDRSEVMKVSYKARQICDMVSEVEISRAKRLYGTPNDTTGEYVKALVVSREKQERKGNVIPIRPDPDDEVSFF